MIYYDKDNIRVRDSVIGDVDAMKNRLRESDVKEIWASHHHTPEEGLKLCVENSIMCFTIENGRPIGIFGISPTNLLGDQASIFLLSTDDLKKIEKRFLRNCRKFIDYMLSHYPYLDNYVHAENKKSIEWLKFLGATVEEAVPYGISKEMFHHFYFVRKD
jgi:hypothetical protein